MKKQKYIIAFILLLFVCDYSVGLAMRSFILKVKGGIYGIINEGLTTTAEICIIGSSRARHHYNENKIEKLTNKSVVNLGIGGAGMPYYFAMLKELLINHSPSIIIIDLSPNIISDKEGLSKLGRFRPYVNKYSAFKEIVQLDSNYHWINEVSSTYHYNSTLLHFTRNLWITEPEGFVPLTGEIKMENYKRIIPDQPFIRDLDKRFFERIVDLRNNYNFRLMMVVSPEFEKFDVNNFVTDYFKNEADKYNVEFYDLSKWSEVYGKSNYFKDQLHLNHRGAEIYTKYISQLIQYDNKDQ